MADMVKYENVGGNARAILRIKYVLKKVKVVSSDENWNLSWGIRRLAA